MAVRENLLKCCQVFFEDYFQHMAVIEKVWRERPERKEKDPGRVNRSAWCRWQDPYRQ
jgi:hypothetical protein